MMMTNDGDLLGGRRWAVLTQTETDYWNSMCKFLFVTARQNTMI